MNDRRPSEIETRTVQPVPLSREQRRWLEECWAHIDGKRLADLDVGLTNIPSPSGQERAVAEFLVEDMRRAGLEALYQPLDNHQGNAVGRLRGRGNGPDLLLYAPLDTVFTDQGDEDVPWLGGGARRDLQSPGFVDGENIIGLGAENPNAYVTCVVAAVEAVKRAAVPLTGSVLVGLGAGGVPTNKRPGLERWNIAHGSGCAFMLQQGIRGDFAIIAKPGYAVSWEEVGLCWFRVRVQGTLGYVGSRHEVPYKNPIVEAYHVITGLEDWFHTYSERHASGLVRPQGCVGAIEGGWKHKPAFIPAACDVYVDLRITPRTDPAQAKREFADALTGIQAAHPGLDLDWDMILSIPGSHTDPTNWIIQSLMRAWEFVEGRPHAPIVGTSGTTDAGILRSQGIPTGRLGMQRPRPSPYPGFSMGVANVESMAQLTKCLVYSVIDTCTRSCDQVGPQK